MKHIPRPSSRSILTGIRMFIVQGTITCVLGVATYWWMVDFPENSHRSFKFLTKEESIVAAKRIHQDRGDVLADSFAVKKVLVHATDIKVYGFSVLFFLQNVVSTALSYFLPIILERGMGFSSGMAILLSAPPYYWAVVPASLSSFVGDKYRLRGPVIIFNAVCLIAGFGMLGFSDHVAVRYVGTFVATGAYVANWAALSAYQANNIVGWARPLEKKKPKLTRCLQAVEARLHVRNVYCFQRGRRRRRELHCAQSGGAKLFDRSVDFYRASITHLVRA